MQAPVPAVPIRMHLTARNTDLVSCSKGAIYATTRSSLTIKSSRFQNNTSGSGGAISLIGCGAKAKTSTITHSVFSNNQAVTSNGGAIRSQSCPAFAIADTTFAHNIAKKVRLPHHSVMLHLLRDRNLCHSRRYLALCCSMVQGGGALYMSNCGSTVGTLSRCFFSDNRDNNAAADASVAVHNCASPTIV